MRGKKEGGGRVKTLRVNGAEVEKVKRWSVGQRESEEIERQKEDCRHKTGFYALKGMV